MKKKMLSGALTATLLFTLPLGAMAAPEPEILINGQRLDSPQAPVIQNGRTLVPFRAIAQGLGAAVHYDAPTKQITAAKGDTILVLTLNGRTMIVNGQEKTLDVPPSLINNYTMLPARAFTEALGGTVAWENGQIIITTVEETTVEETVQELTDAALGKVTLAKHYLDEELKYWSLSVQGREVARIAEDGSYFHGNLEIQDLTGDGQPELLLFRHNTGSSGAVALNVYSWQGEGYAPVFTDRNWHQDGEFVVSYRGDYAADFYHGGTGLYTLIPIEQKEYDENLLKNISTWIDPVIKYEFPEGTGGEAKDIVTEQRVIGVAHPHTLATLKTTYRFADGKYKPVKITLFDENNRFLAEGYYEFTGLPAFMNEQSVVILAAEAVSRSWYVLGGGRIGDRWETFERDGIPYRYLGEDLSTKKKLTSYLSVVFTEEAVAAFLRDYGIIENQGRMAQPDADGGSLLEWDKASASLIDEGDDWKRYELKVPYPVGDDVEYEVVQIKVQLSDQGWLLDSLVF